MEEIVIAILAKDKEYCLDFYLNCILNQTYDKKKIHLYIRTNDNKDNTQDILDNFIKTYSKEYASVYYDNSSITEKLKKYDEHEWNSERFKIFLSLKEMYLKSSTCSGITCSWYTSLFPAITLPK